MNFFVPIASTRGAVAVLLLLSFCRYNQLYGQSSECKKIYLDDSFVRFSIEHMGILEVNGEFDEFEGGLCFRQGNSIESNNLSMGNLKIKVNSVNTGNELRDRSLLSEKFLKQEQYPFIEVLLDSLTGNNAAVTIFIMGTQAKLSIPVELGLLNGSRQQIKNISGEVVISRVETGIIFESTMDSMIGDDITVMFNLSIN